MAQKLCDRCDSLVHPSDAACGECGGSSFTTLDGDDDDVDVAHLEADAARSRNGSGAPGGGAGQTTWAAAVLLLLVVALPWAAVRLVGWWGLLAVGLIWPIQRFVFPKHWRDDLAAADAHAEARRVEIATRKNADKEREDRIEAKRRARAEAERAEAARFAVIEVGGTNEQLVELGTGYLEALRACIDQHIDTLARKRSTLIQQDDYGVIDASAWERERVYFVKRVLTPALASALQQRGGERHARYLRADAKPEALGGMSFAGDGRRAPMVCRDEIEARVTARQIQRDAEGTPGFVPSAPSAAGLEFEHYCAAVLSAAGWQARVTSASGDQGVDVIAERGGFRLAVQCKWYSSPVGNEAVQQVTAGLPFYGAHAGVVVSNAGYTSAAKQLATATGVLLLHDRDLVTGAERARTGWRPAV